MLLKIQSLLIWLFIGISCAALFAVALVIWAVTSPFDRRKVLLHQFTCFWASLYTWINPAWPVEVIDRSNFHSDGPCVIVCNHLSLLDILLLFRLFKHFKWVSKVENFRVPFMGWNMSLNGYISLKRGDAASIVKMLRNCQRALAEGNSLMIFPEGTRSLDGQMRSFRPGAFEIAMKAGVPIQPLVIQGTAEALPNSAVIMTGHHPISLRVLEPVSPESYRFETAAELCERVRKLIAAHVIEPAPPRPSELPGASQLPGVESEPAA